MHHRFARMAMADLNLQWCIRKSYFMGGNAIIRNNLKPTVYII
jgi:hypothetical protein